MMEINKKKLGGMMLGLLFLATGCATTYIPEPTNLRRIESIPYVPDKMDCKHKSVMRHNYLKSRGVESRVVEGAVNGGGRHAWTEVKKDDKWFMNDPTHYGSDGWEVSEYPERKVFYIYGNDVTVEDIRNKKYEEKFMSNIFEWYGVN